LFHLFHVFVKQNSPISLSPLAVDVIANNIQFDAFSNLQSLTTNLHSPIVISA